MPKNEFTTMVMIQDKHTGKVLVQNRVKSWKGLSFPGGHVENGESFYDCAVREVKEEPDWMFII
ncbi:MAG: NUDIX domain-containing protein [Eubacteriales bacterium]|nr:NUDIX domain-containing protein [Eubacteriales bacterium]